MAEQYRSQNKYQGSNYGYTPKTVEAKPLPRDYVDVAEQVILSLNRNEVITKTKLRNLYSMITEISNMENRRLESELLPESQAQLMRTRVRMVYEAGRERNVKIFLEQAKLLEYMKDIGTSREKLMNYSGYMEALVAYHRYHFDREKGR